MLSFLTTQVFALWTAPEDLSEAGANACCPRVDINDVGQSIAVWVRGYSTQATTTTFGSMWSAPVTLKSVLDEIGYAPCVGINSSGVALVVWGGGFLCEPFSGAFSATHIFDYGWSAPVAVYMGELDQDARMVFNDAGQGVTCLFNKVAPSKVKAAKYSLGGSWEAPFTLSTSGATSTEGQVAMNDDGRLACVWLQAEGAYTSVYGQLSTYNGFWPTVWPMYGARLSTLGCNASIPQVVINSENKVMVVWVEFDGVNSVIKRAYLKVGDWWSQPETLSLGGQNASEPSIAMNNYGQYVVVWVRNDGVHDIVQAITSTYGSSLPSIVDLSDPGENAGHPRVTMNDEGQVVVVWTRFDGSHDILQGRSYLFGGSWSEVANLSASGQEACHPDVAINNKGEVIAVWARNSGVNQIISSSTTVVKSLPILNLSGEQKGIFNQVGGIDYFNTLRWEKSPSGNIIAYNIYRNNLLIATLSSIKHSFFHDWNQPMGEAQTYKVTSVNSGGAESDGVEISVP